MGVFSNIDQEGFLAPAFHAFPDRLQPDGISGDNGPSLFGHAWNTATYIVNHPEFGWLSFGGNTHIEGDEVRVTPLDSFRSRVYVASQGVWLTLDAGAFEEIRINSRTGAIRVGLSSGTRYLHAARLRIEQPARTGGGSTGYRPTKSFNEERGAYVVPLDKETAWIELAARP
jgi:hypothetical protein